MRKVFTSCALLLGLSIASMAQPLATFEEGATDNLIMDGWFMPELFVISPSIMENPLKTGLNTSEKCLGAVNVADADWWGNFLPLKLTQPIEITENNRYLKFLAYRSIQPKEMQVDIKAVDNLWRGKLAEDAKWYGMVIDLERFLGQELDVMKFVLSTNWGDPRTGWGVATYAFDNFELSNDPLPSGIVPVTDLSGFNLNFENETVTNQWIKKYDVFNETSSYEIVDNPVKTGVNSSDKVIKFNKGADASWWQGLNTEFTGAMKLDEGHKYMHVMVRVPKEALDNREAVDVQLCAKDFLMKENTYTQGIWDDEVDEWIDVVMELNKIEYLTDLTVRFDIRKNDVDEYINAPANTFYIDGIVLNNDPNPRTQLSGIKVLDISNVKVLGGKGSIDVVTSEPLNLKVYNVQGVLLKEVATLGNVSIPSISGLYIVKAESNGQQQTTKVLVK